MRYKIILLCISAFIISACGGESEETNSVSYNKIESIKNIISNDVELPSPILDLKFIEYSKGIPSRVPGPTDYEFFLRIKVAKSDLAKWSNNLKPPYNNTNTFASPQTPQDWWISKTIFQNMKLYETKTYFNRFNGWLCIDKSNGYIYAYTFTM